MVSGKEDFMMDTTEISKSYHSVAVNRFAIVFFGKTPDLKNKFK